MLIAILFTACGENTTTEKIVEVASGGTEIVESVKYLPKCTKDNQGEQALVKGESSVRVCVDGKWFATKESAKDTVFLAGDTVVVAGDTVYLNGGDFSCTTKELKDGSGIKIVCNGDSIGVVLNGAKGDKGDAGADGKNGTDGKNGVGCSIAAQTDSSATIKCGDKSMTLNLRTGGAVVDTTSSDTLELDSEKVAISMDSMAGYSQKGPFLTGSRVYLYELTDGRTLKQTNGNFTSEITSDDGRYKFNSRNLVSQYALLVVDGKYRNEITGQPTNTSIQLQAYTNMLMRKSANVNLLTHLEKERVFYLVTKEKMTVRAAKRQAQAEILAAFHIDASQIKAESEDLDVFGKTDADAALLAISILLQRDSSETELSVLLTNMANDLAEDGTWDNAAKKAEIADWVATIDSNVSTSKSKLATFRSNVKGWGLGGGNVPDFEKFVRRFWSEQLGLGVCGSDSVPVGLVKHVPNKDSKKYYATSYTDAANKIRFICDDASLYRWRAATDIEKDTLGWATEYNDAKEGDIHNGRVNSNKTYVYENKNWRYGTNVDSLIGKGCVTGRKDTVALGSDKNWYKCVNQAWRVATNIEKDTATWGNDFNTGDIRNGQINKNLTYVYQNNKWRLGTTLDSLLVKESNGLACLNDGDTSKVKYNNVYYVCSANTDGAVRGWKKAPDLYNDTYDSREQCSKTGKYGDGTILAGRVNISKKYVCDNAEFRLANDTELGWNRGCVYDIYGISVMFDGQYSYYKCSAKGWEYDFENLNEGTVTYGGKTYRTIGIKTQYWMAENLDFEYKVDGASYGNYCNSDNCETYGRYYTWAAAMDSAGVYSTNGKGCGYGKTCSPTGTIRGVCPEGWHLPSSSEWSTLYSAMGSSPYAMQAKGFANWPSATDAYGFSALPAGYYDPSYFSNVGVHARFWSAVEYVGSNARYWYLDAGSANLRGGYKDNGFSVRCVKD